MKNYFIAFILFFAFTTNAQTGSWEDTGNYDTSWFQNGITSFNITNEQELAGLAWLVKQGHDFVSSADTTFTLTNDLNLNAHFWEPIGFATEVGADNRPF